MKDQPQQPVKPAAPASFTPALASATPAAPVPCPECKPPLAIPGFWCIILTPPLGQGQAVDKAVHEYEGGGARFNFSTPEAHVSFLCQDRKGVADALMTYLNLAPAVVGEHNVEVLVKSGKKQRKFMLRDLINMLAFFRVKQIFP